MTRVGFIGLGDQGGGMAQRLIECGVPTTLWARRNAALEPFRGTSASIAESRAALGSASDIVGICVVDDAGVEEVVLGGEGVLRGMAVGSLLAIHSTISLKTCRAIAVEAAACGVGIIDAPVSGGRAAAARGELTVMVGGETPLVEQARPMLDTFGGAIIHLGPLGSGLLTKLLNNVLHTAHYALAQDALMAGAALGLDTAALGKALSLSSGNSMSLKTAVGMGSVKAMAPFVGSLLRKDVGIFADLVEEQGAPTGSLIAVADEALRYLEHARDR